jgi:PAS domain S-box-containing protein
MKKILSGDSRNIDEYVFVRKDGTRFAVLLSSAPVVRDGKVVGLREIVVDVGERKKTDEVPRQSEDRYAMLSAAAFEAIGIFEQGKMVDANDQLAKMLGYELSELVGKDVLDFVAPESRDMVTETMRKGIEGPYEHLALRKGGSVFPVEVRTRPIQYKGRTAVVISIRDVTEEKKLEKSLWENGEKFAGLLSGSPEATVFTDSKMNIVEVNPRFVSLFGFKEEEVKGKRLNDVIVPENMTEEGRMLDSKAQEGYVYHETVRKRKDGSIVPVSVSAVPIVVKGSLVGNVAMYNDISKLKIADAAMKEMLQKMILANEKLRVVGGVTRHDVRNKLSTVLGNVYLLRKQGADAALLDKLKDMETAVHQVTQIFEFAKDYESLGVEELAYVDVGKDFEKAIGLFSDLKHAIITNNCTGLMVLADSLLKRLFYNLVDNSLKHGQKTSRIEIRYQEASRDELTLYYEDDGGGIPDETKPNLFKEGFTTGNGAGYGLYLVKKMTEVYGWAIMETGVPGKGAQFKITIPRMNKKAKENYQIAPQS